MLLATLDPIAIMSSVVASTLAAWFAFPFGVEGRLALLEDWCLDGLLELGLLPVPGLFP